MIIGVVSDTHDVSKKVIREVVKKLIEEHKVELIFHCGDIEAEHLDAELFGNLPVICALTKGQVDDIKFQWAPSNWCFTYPDDRVRYISRTIANPKVCIRHAFAFQYLKGSGRELEKELAEIRQKYDGVRYVCAGHMHHQTCFRSPLIDFINPGAVIETTTEGHEFAVVNTENGEIIFSRILATNPVKKPFSVGVISDTLNISELDPKFWHKLVSEMEKRGVRHIIHCGNIAINDIGRKELANFDVYYYLRPDQASKKVPDPSNWHKRTSNDPVVEIEGCSFCIQFELGVDLMKHSEVGLDDLCGDLRKKYPETSYVLCGLSNSAFYEEGQVVKIINPGSAKEEKFCVICMPSAIITFGHISPEN